MQLALRSILLVFLLFASFGCRNTERYLDPAEIDGEYAVLKGRDGAPLVFLKHPIVGNSLPEKVTYELVDGDPSSFSRWDGRKHWLQLEPGRGGHSLEVNYFNGTPLISGRVQASGAFLAGRVYQPVFDFRLDPERPRVKFIEQPAPE